MAHGRSIGVLLEKHLIVMVLVHIGSSHYRHTTVNLIVFVTFSDRIKAISTVNCRSVMVRSMKHKLVFC